MLRGILAEKVTRKLRRARGKLGQARASAKGKGMGGRGQNTEEYGAEKRGTGRGEGEQGSGGRGGRKGGEGGVLP